MMEKCGEHKLRCKYCNCVYLGRAFSSFETRIEEHLTTIWRLAHHSLFAIHLLDAGHSKLIPMFIFYILSKEGKH